MENVALNNRTKLENVTAEIKELKRQANQMALAYAVEIGRRLSEAKTLVPHGQWGIWLRDEAEFSQSTANNFMRLFEEYGDKQMTIFGAVVNSQTIANLPYTKALQLLALPADEREQFAKEEDAESKSVRELSEAIKERNRAREEAEQLKSRENRLKEELEKLSKEKENAVAEAHKTAKLKEQIEALQKREKVLTEKVKKETQRAEATEQKLKDALENPQLTEEKLDEIKRNIMKESDTYSLESIKAEKEILEKKFAETSGALHDAQERIKAREQKISELEKKIKVANPEIAEFKTIFDEIQILSHKLFEKLEKIRNNDEKIADKLEAAVNIFINSLKK